MSRLSIRTKLTLVFMFLFTLTLPVSFFWFYQFATDLVMSELRQSLMNSAQTAANLIHVDEHTQVYRTGAEGDAQYTHIAEQLRLVKNANAKITAIYTLVRSDQATKLRFGVDLDDDPNARAHLRSAYDASDNAEMLAAFKGAPTADREVGADQFGTWLAGYAPIKDAQGNTVAIVGVDMTVEDVVYAQTQVRNASILAFIITYLGALAFVFFLAGNITKPLRAITDVAGALEQAEPFEPQRLEKVAAGADELAQLARVFSRMAIQVQAREQKLKKQVTELQIEIDQVKRQKQVAEIVENEDFQSLQARARELKRQRLERQAKPPT